MFPASQSGSNTLDRLRTSWYKKKKPAVPCRASVSNASHDKEGDVLRLPKQHKHHAVDASTV